MKEPSTPRMQDSMGFWMGVRAALKGAFGTDAGVAQEDTTAIARSIERMSEAAQELTQEVELTRTMDEAVYELTREGPYRA